MSSKLRFSSPVLLLIPVVVLSIVLFKGVRSKGFATASLAAASEESSSYLPLILYPASPTPTLTPTATHPPEPTNTPVPTPIPEDDWLGYINFLRYQSGLPGVSSNVTWSDGCWLHSRYMVKNDDVTHSEDSK